MKTLINIIFGILVGLLAAGVILVAGSRPQGNQITLLPTATPGLLTVYVSGAVAAPGVYSLPEGSRVEAAILAAGGFTSGADLESINQAAPLEDGQQVTVSGNLDTSHINVGRVNINSATVVELDALPGIGPTAAQAIIDYRLQNGPFPFTQDIQKVPGIGPATFEKIKDYITVGP
jgi:competence protein ComEA